MKTINNKNTIKTDIKYIFLTIKYLELGLGRKTAETPKWVRREKAAKTGIESARKKPKKIE